MRASTVLVVVATIVGCAHSQPSREEPTATNVAPEPVRSSAVRPLTFAGACVPNVLRVPVRADIEPRRTPNIDQVVFLRPLCITDHGETICRGRPDVLTVDQSNRAFHGDGVGVLSVIYAWGRFSVTLDKLDDTIPLADGLALTEAASVIEDGCVTIPWPRDGLGTLQGIRGDFTRDDPKGPWMFRPSPKICAQAHVPGDDRVYDTAFPVTGKGTTAIPKTGLSGARITGALLGPPGPVSAVADAVMPQPEWRVR